MKYHPEARIKKDAAKPDVRSVLAEGDNTIMDLKKRLSHCTNPHMPRPRTPHPTR